MEGLDPGVTVKTDFEIPTMSPEEKALQSLSEEELTKKIEAGNAASVPATTTPTVPTLPEVMANKEQTKIETGDTTPRQEAPEAPTTEDVSVPKKFQKPDGTLDEAKLDKSIDAIKAKLSDYLIAEKELTKTRQGNKTDVIPEHQTPANGQDNFLQRFKEDFANNPEETILKLANAVETGTKSELMGKIEQLENLFRLKEMSESNPDMLNQSTFTELKQIRSERPHLTWEDALEIQRGRLAIKGKGISGATQTKPQVPIVPGGTASTFNTGVPKVTIDKVQDLLKGKTPLEQEALLEKILPHK